MIQARSRTNMLFCPKGSVVRKIEVIQTCCLAQKAQLYAKSKSYKCAVFCPKGSVVCKIKVVQMCCFAQTAQSYAKLQLPGQKATGKRKKPEKSAACVDQRHTTKHRISLPPEEAHSNPTGDSPHSMSTIEHDTKNTAWGGGATCVPPDREHPLQRRGAHMR